MSNLKSAVRQLAKRPALATLVVATLAIGIGANTAMFSLFHQVLLRPLPVPEPERLVVLGAPGPKMGGVSCSDIGGCEQLFSYPMLKDLEREQTVFTGIAAHRGFGANIAAEGAMAISTEGVAVNGAYFSVLGLEPALGRLIGREDEPKVGEGRVVVLSYEYWQNGFGGDRGVLDKVLTVNGQRMTVIGVAPKGFTGASVGSRPQVFVPLTMRWRMEPFFPESSENRLAYWVYLFARLKPGVTVEQAESTINGPYRAIINDVEVPLNAGGSEQYLADFREKTLTLEPGARGQSRALTEAGLPLTLLLAITGLVLVIACANIANLLLARGAMRAGEMAVRSAMGASRGQMVLQLLAEAAVLGLLGCVAGLPVAAVTLRVIGAVMPAGAAADLNPALSGAAILFGAAAGFVTVLLFGLFPALAATRAPAGTVLKEQAGQQAGSRGMARFRRTLAIAQIAFSMALLVVAGLFAQSLANVARIDLGLAPEKIATFTLSPVLNGYPPERSSQFFRAVEERLEALPGVTSVASAMVAVIGGSTWGGNVSVEGFEAPPEADMQTQYNEVSPAFFRTLGIPLLSGRDFTDADSAGRPQVALVNEAFAEKFGLGDDAVGKRFAFGSGGPLEIEIIGRVADAKYSTVKEEIPPQVYLPVYQDEELGFINFYVRANREPGDLLASVAGVVEELDPNLPVEDLSTLPDVIRDGVSLDRMISLLSGGFALIATLLAATGLYGVLAYSVAQRTRELGVRQALGATPGRLRSMVLAQVGRMGLIGGAIGLLLAVMLGRAAEAVLFGLSGYDPVVLTAATVALAAVIAAAGYLPARRASSIDPLKALRHE